MVRAIGFWDWLKDILSMFKAMVKKAFGFESEKPYEIVDIVAAEDFFGDESGLEAEARDTALDSYETVPVAALRGDDDMETSIEQNAQLLGRKMIARVVFMGTTILVAKLLASWRC